MGVRARVLAALLAASALGGAALGTTISEGAMATAEQRTGDGEKPGAFVLSVQLRFVDATARAEAREAFAPYASWIRDNEPGTLGYVWADSDKEDGAHLALIHERYTDKAAYVGAHRSSERFLEWRAYLSGLQTAGKVSVSGESYYEGPGFVDR